MSDANDILDSVRFQLNDPDCVRWSDDELVGYLSQAQRQIVMMVPSAYTVTEDVALAESANKIALPSGGIAFLAAHTVKDGSTMLRSMSYVERDVLDSWDPDWQGTEDADGPQHFMHDARHPTEFWVYPARDATRASMTIEMTYSKEPPAVASSVATLSLSAIYDQAMVDYVVYRALTREGRYSLPSSTIDRLWGTFAQSLGLKAAYVRSEAPYTQRPPENSQ